MTFDPFNGFDPFGGGAAPFNPLTLSPALWLSDTGSDPAQWDDLSGNGRHATQATAGNRPAIVTGALNGRQVRRFDGLNDSLENLSFGSPNGATAMTIFLVVVPSSFDNAMYMEHGLFGWRESGSWGIVGMKPLAQRINYRFGTGQASNDNYWVRPSSKSGLATITGALKSGSTEQLYVDGTLVASSGSKLGTVANTSGALKIGGLVEASTYVAADVAEIMVFMTALDPSARQNVERYLGAKYGISVA